MFDGARGKTQNSQEKNSDCQYAVLNRDSVLVIFCLFFFAQNLPQELQ